jgi:hypothetical protein
MHALSVSRRGDRTTKEFARDALQECTPLLEISTVEVAMQLLYTLCTVEFASPFCNPLLESVLEIQRTSSRGISQ